MNTDKLLTKWYLIIVGLGYLTILLYIALFCMVMPTKLLINLSLFSILFSLLSVGTLYVYFSPQKVNSMVRNTLNVLYVSVLLLTCIISIYAAINYRFNFMLRLTGSLVKTSIQAHQTTVAPFNSFKLFLAYSKMMFNHALRPDYPTIPHRDNILGHCITSYSYYDLNSIIHEIFTREIYKFQTPSEQPFIIDCGSNIGMAILYFKKVFPNAEILGFEPDEKTYQALSANITNNNLTNVTVHQKALHPTLKSLTFFTKENAPGYPGMNLFGMFGCSTKKEVQATALSPFINKPVDFLKIDIEGSEAEIIKDLNAHNKLSLIKQMVIEFHPDKNSLANTLKVLENNKFKYIISSNARIPFTSQDADDLLLIYAFNQTYL